MAKYKAIFSKQETYIIEADSVDEAGRKAWEMLHNDEFAFIDEPIDKIEIKEIENQ